MPILEIGAGGECGVISGVLLRAEERKGGGSCSVGVSLDTRSPPAHSCTGTTAGVLEITQN